MKTSCDEIRGWLDAYLDDELSTRDRRKVEHHIARCAVCRALLADLGQMEEALSEEARESDPGPGYFKSFRERFEQRFDLSSARREWRPPARTAPRYAKLPFRMAPLARVAAVLVIAAALGGVLHRLGTLPLEPRIDLGRTAAPGGSGTVTPAGSATEGASTVPEAEGVTAGDAAGKPTEGKVETKGTPAAALPPSAAGGNVSPEAAAAEKIPPPAPAPEQRAERPVPDREARPPGNTLPAAPAEPDPAGVASYFAALESGGRTNAGPVSEKRTWTAAREPIRGEPPQGASRFAPGPVPAEQPPPSRGMERSKDRLPLGSTLLLAGEADSTLPDSLWTWSWLATARVRARTALTSRAQSDCRSALLAYWRMGNRNGRDLFPDPRDRDRAYAADRARIAALLECAGSG